MAKKAVFVGVAILLLCLPLAVRWIYFYVGRYEPGKVARPDLAAIEAPVSEMGTFVDHPTRSDPGIILVDLAHDNRLEIAELNVLQARLTGRGQELEIVRSTDDLDKQLQYAKALIVVSPGDDWAADDIDKVQSFVDKGGRLLLVTDPTRFAVEFDETEVAILDEDVPHINDLAARFGIVFQSDYLYNTIDNAGNFRNIKLTQFAEHDLTQGLDQVVFYATHSIESEEPALISTSGDTRSSDSERIEPLAVAVLGANQAVLALGDLTFMTEPYNAVYDNERLIANIADFLSNGERQYDLADLPFFFDDQVDLVYAGDPVLDGNLVRGASTLQALFAAEGKELSIREAEDKSVDTLFFGLYAGSAEVDSYLDAAQVTLLVTPTTALKEKENTEPKASASAGSVEVLTSTAAMASAPKLAATPPAKAPSDPGLAATAEISPSIEGRIEIKSLGESDLTGTLLFVLHSESDRQVMIVLTDTEAGMDNAIERMAIGSLKGCLLHQREKTRSGIIALCPTGTEASETEARGRQKPEPPAPTPTPSEADPAKPITPTIEPSQTVTDTEQSILVIALDDGQGEYDNMTSAQDYVEILEDQYDVTVWHKGQDAPLDTGDLPGYDLVIWSAGDYRDAFGSIENELLLLLMLEGIPVIMSGAYVGETDTQSIQRDIQVNDATHPIARGFGPSEVVDFVPSPSGSEYAVYMLEESEEEDGVAVFVRGPESEEAGAPTIFAFDDEASRVQVVFISFPLYLLPEEARTRLVQNTAAWMLSPPEQP